MSASECGLDSVYLDGCGYYCSCLSIRQDLSAAPLYRSRFFPEHPPVKLICSPGTYVPDRK
jgi:hypothetical protein